MIIIINNIISEYDIDTSITPEYLKNIIMNIDSSNIDKLRDSIGNKNQFKINFLRKIVK